MPTELSLNVLSSLGMEVPLPKIDRALRELWETDNAKTRASLMNFAIYSEDITSMERNNQLLERITADHACRALHIVCLPAAQPQRARAWINALCRPYQSGKMVCSEQITFVLEGGDDSLVQNIVFAHLDSDLPLVVWWQGDLTHNFQERFYSRIQLLIVDSSTWTNPAAEFARICEARGEAPYLFDVRDLSWTRSHFMRTALANCFQDARARELLPQIAKIEVTHAPDHRCAAVLLASWLAQRLGAQPAEPAKGVSFVKPDGGSICVELHECGAGCALRELTVSGQGICVRISRDSASPFVHTCATCEGHSHQEVLPADVVTDADLVSEQLSRAGGNTHYASLLPWMPIMLGR